MSDLLKLLDELDALEKEATPGEWKWEPNSFCSGKLKGSFIQTSQGLELASVNSRPFASQATSESNAALITALRNNWPRISKALRDAYKIFGPCICTSENDYTCERCDWLHGGGE